jgi:hypothetical protein
MLDRDERGPATWSDLDSSSTNDVAIGAEVISDSSVWVHGMGGRTQDLGSLEPRAEGANAMAWSKIGGSLYVPINPSRKFMLVTLIVDEVRVSSCLWLADLTSNTAGSRRLSHVIRIQWESKLFVASVTGRSQDGRQARTTELADSWCRRVHMFNGSKHSHAEIQTPGWGRRSPALGRGAGLY